MHNVNDDSVDFLLEVYLFIVSFQLVLGVAPHLIYFKDKQWKNHLNCVYEAMRIEIISYLLRIHTYT